MAGSLHFGLLALLTGQALAQSSDIITEDTYFYGQSPPSYPGPNATGTGTWADAYVKAKALVSQLTVEEKVRNFSLSTSQTIVYHLKTTRERPRSTLVS